MSYEPLEHTGEAKIRVTGDTLEELFGSALRGMIDTLHPDEETSSDRMVADISLAAPDATVLLVDFLNAALSSAYDKRAAYRNVEFGRLSETGISATLSGPRFRSLGDDINAVTYHEADVRKNDDGVWETSLVFDI